MITLNQVKIEAKKKKTGEKFEIKDLFTGYDWGQETAQNRKDLGREFANHVRGKGSKDFKLIYRKSDNHKVYERL